MVILFFNHGCHSSALHPVMLHGTCAASAFKFARSCATTTRLQIADLQGPPSIPQFEAHFGVNPVLYRGGVAHWKAIERWRCPDYLRERAGHVTVPVEVGATYIDGGLQRVEMPLSLYLDYLSMAPEDEPVESNQLAYMAQAQVNHVHVTIILPT